MLSQENMMRKGILSLVIFVLLLGAPSAARYLQYYKLGGGQAAAPPIYDPRAIADIPTPVAGTFVDEPTVGKGLALLDQAHANNFTLDEIGYLDGRLAARGFELVPYTGGNLATALRSANAFIVITPLEMFDKDEIRAVSEFVARGGRLLMIGDPTRFSVTIEEDFFSFTFTIDTDKLPLNSLTNEFDIIFNGDYLYNTVENEGNFRNIRLNDASLGENSLTDGVNELAFYGSHSLQVGTAGTALLTADDNTWSSATDRAGGLTVAATNDNGRVLAIGDIHFLTAPYYTVFDNSRFIAHIADFLTAPAERQFVLPDFPYFYGNNVNLIYTGAPDLGPNVFDEIIALQDAFRQAGKTLRLAAAPREGEDTLFLGLYNQADDVADILASAGITLTIDPPILPASLTAEAETAAGNNGQSTSGNGASSATTEIRRLDSSLGSVYLAGTALILLDEQDGRRNVLVLAASNDGLENSVARLLDLIPVNASYALADCLVQDELALCPSGVSQEVVEAELIAADGETAEEEPGRPPEEEGEDNADLNAINQGVIELGESVEGTLDEEESHAWVFRDGPLFVDIVLEAGEELDAVLELYGPDNELLDSTDTGFTGEDEQLLGVEIPDDKSYTIVVRDYFEDGGAYKLTVREASDVGGGGGPSSKRIFLFADDDGEALTSGFTSVSALAALLDGYDVTTWVSTEDGPLQADTLDGYGLVIWDSGDYRNEDGFFDEDTAVIFDYLDSGGNLLIIGASPTLLGAAELAPVSDVEVSGDDPVLLDGLTAGDVFSLDQTYEAVTTSLFGDTSGDITFLVRGPVSDNQGDIVGLAGSETGGAQKSVLLLVPFTALPTAVQATLLNNLMAWFGLSEQ
jgi:hypothetical protein